MLMNFVAIDFETANARRASPCSLGITVIENGKVVEEKYWMIRPNPLEFNNINIAIHGIRESDVVCEKEFNELWDEIKPYLENRLVIAHNASFDISVLRNTLDLYGIDYPCLNYCCTMVLSKLFYRYLPNSKLNTVNRHLNYKFNHHNAMEDATAAANILLNISNELNLKHINDISDIIGFKLGSLKKDTYTPCKRNSYGIISKRANNFNIADLESDLFKSKSKYFQGKVVVFTGQLSSMERVEASRLIESLGGVVRTSVSKKTDILITNVPNIENMEPSKMTTKLRAAVFNIKQGQNINIINELELEELLLL